MSSTLPNTKLNPAANQNPAGWRLRIKDAAFYALVLSVVVIVFAFQSHHIGFWTLGHGWTSIHGLALMTHATPETGLVGYSQAFRLEDGSIAYRYFDRYPFFLNATLHLLLGITDHLPTEIMLFRHLMNVVFLATMAVGYRLVRLFMENRFLALAVTVMSFASYHLLFYKDMIHYDQPALLLMLSLVYVIARYRQGVWNQWAVFGMAMLAVSIGRGYVSFFVLGLWFALEALTTLFGSGVGAVPPRKRLGAVLRHPSLWITVIAVTWAGSWLFYNVVTEAQLRNIPLEQTSVVKSAFRRLPLVGDAVEGETSPAALLRDAQSWLQFAVVQTERLVLWALPAKFGGDMPWRFVPLEDELVINPLRLAAGIGLFGVALAFVFRTRPPLRVPAALMAFSGVVWLYFMFDLSADHDYITMYGLGLSLVVYTALFRWAQQLPVVVGALVVVSIVLFGVANQQVRADMREDIAFGSLYTHDFNRIRPTIDGNKNTVYLDYDYPDPECIIIENYVCYALGYYLDDNYLSKHLHVANYVLSPRPFFTTKRFVPPGETVQIIPRPTVPHNDKAFLLDLATAQERTLPEESAPIVRYGEAFTLQSWTLDGDVNVSACDTVYIESWWLAETQPDANYNMQIVMVTNDGGEITEANAPLGRVPTRLWETNRFVLDVRPVNIPCDTPPGEYPLIMGVYNPQTLAPLPVTGGAGEPMGNQFYLTTLFVQ